MALRPELLAVEMAELGMGDSRPTPVAGGDQVFRRALGIPAREDAIGQVNAWLDEAERLAGMR
jgi:hypothetical protein